MSKKDIVLALAIAFGLSFLILTVKYRAEGRILAERADSIKADWDESEAARKIEAKKKDAEIDRQRRSADDANRRADSIASMRPSVVRRVIVNRSNPDSVVFLTQELENLHGAEVAQKDQEADSLRAAWETEHSLRLAAEASIKTLESAWATEHAARLKYELALNIDPGFFDRYKDIIKGFGVGLAVGKFVLPRLSAR